MRTGQGVRPLTVPATTAPNSVTPITAPCRLVGWSLMAGNVAGNTAYGTQTSPAALAVIADLGTLPAGEYTLNWQVELSGTLAAADVNNFEVSQAGIQIATSINEATASAFLQEPIQLVIPAGGATVRIKNIGAGTAGSVYAAMMTLTGGPDAQATIFDSKQPLGIVSAPQGFPDTESICDEGVYVSTSLTLTVLAGTLSGVFYVTDFADDAYSQGK